MRNRLVIALVVLINAALALFGSMRQPVTSDEVRQVSAGLHHWHTGTFEEARETPPLARLVAALPVLACPSSRSPALSSEATTADGTTTATHHPADVAAYRLTRIPGFVWWAIGAWFIYCWTTSLYGDKAGILAFVLWASNPNILAREQTATPDLPCAVACVAATYAFWRWLQKPSWPLAIAVGVLLGLAQLTDFAALGLPVAWLVLGIAYGLVRGHTKRWRTFTRRSAQAIAGVFVALFIVNAGYGFSDTAWKLKDFRFVSHALSGKPTVTDIEDGEAGGNPLRESWIGKTIVPVPLDYIAGIDLKIWTSERRDKDRAGGPSRAIDRGPFEPDILLARMPAGLLFLSIAAFAWMLLRRRGHAAIADELPVWITAAVIVELALSPAEFLFSMPVMLVLPVPFLTVGIGVLGAAFDGLQPARKGEPPCEPPSLRAMADNGSDRASPSPRVGTVPFPCQGPRQWLYVLPVAALTMWTLASGFVASLHPLTYANEIATLWPGLAPRSQQLGPGDRTDALVVPADPIVLPADRPGALQGRRARSLRGIATEGDLVALRGWLDKHPDANPLGLAHLGGINPRRLGIDFRLPPHDPGPKLADAPWYTARTGPYPGYFALDQQSLSLDRYRYFNQFKPIARVGDSIAVYHVMLDQAEHARRTMGRKPLGTLAKRMPGPAEHGLLERVFKYPDGRSYNYAVFIPDDYAGDRLYPVILFLHGHGEIAANAYLQVTFPAAIKEQKHTFSFIAVIPQGRSGDWDAGDADSKAAMDVLARVENQYRVDSTRIYLTGVSSGGWGVWELAAAYPHRWAAIVPVASPGNPGLAPRIAQIPCWCFFNSFDSSRSVVGVRRMIAALREAGGAPRYTEFQDLTADLSRGLFMARHNCWDRAYNMLELYEWMIQQSRPISTAAAVKKPEAKR